VGTPIFKPWKGPELEENEPHYQKAVCGPVISCFILKMIQDMAIITM